MLITSKGTAQGIRPLVGLVVHVHGMQLIKSNGGKVRMTVTSIGKPGLLPGYKKKEVGRVKYQLFYLEGSFRATENPQISVFARQ